MTQFKLGYGAAATVILLLAVLIVSIPRSSSGRRVQNDRQGSALIIVVVGIIAFIWMVPIIGIVVTSLRPPEGVSLGWWRFDHLDLTLSAWRRVWDKYPLAQSMWVTMKTAGIATALTMLLTPAAAYAFHFLTFPLRRVLLIIIINAFVLPQQVVIIPLSRFGAISG
ncbi:hypothetical protein ACOJBO_13315 [Rhizobium beringeri]